MQNQEFFPVLLRDTFFAWRNELDKRLKPFGLSQAKWRVLLSLYISNESLTQIALAKQLGIESPTLVGLLDRLTKDGWLERRDDPSDRRSKTVHLTEKAREMSKNMREIAEKLKLELLSNIDQAEINICSKVLQQIKQKLNNY